LNKFASVELEQVHNWWSCLHLSTGNRWLHEHINDANRFKPVRVVVEQCALVFTLGQGGGRCTVWAAQLCAQRTNLLVGIGFVFAAKAQPLVFIEYMKVKLFAKMLALY
jgi:hypothetical protein